MQNVIIHVHRALRNVPVFCRILVEAVFFGQTLEK